MGEKRIKVGILGGTFDPIHLGHLILASEAMESFQLDKMLLIPTGHSYLKDHKEEKVQSSGHRYRMTALAAEQDPRLEVSDIEVKRPGNSYTADTLRELEQAHPDWELYYIVGADTLCMMRKWVRPNEIFERCTILAAQRSDETAPEELELEIKSLQDEFHARILRLPVRNIEISSTDIRGRVRERKSIRYLVSEPVIRYIYDNKLYCAVNQSTDS